MGSPTPAQQWVSRFLEGFRRPFRLVGGLRQQPVAWRAYLLTVGVQATLTLLAGSAYFVYHLPTARSEAEPVVEARDALKVAKRERVRANQALERAAKALETQVSGKPDPRVAAAEAKLKAAEARAAAQAQRREAQLKKRRWYSKPRPAEDAEAAQDAKEELDDARAALEELRADSAEELKTAREALDESRRQLLPPPPPAPPLPAPPPRAETIKAQVRAALEQAGVRVETEPAAAGLKQALEQAGVAPDTAEKLKVALEKRELPPEARAALDDAQATEEAKAVAEVVQAAVEKAGPAAKAALARAEAALPPEARKEVAAALAGGPRTVEEAQEQLQAATERFQEAQGKEGEAQDALREAEEASDLGWWKYLGLWVSALVLAQYVVLALSRDYQDRVARDLSLAAGLRPEDEPASARIRLDLKWVLRKLRRKWRGALAVGAGVMLLSPLIVVGAFFGLRHELTSAVVFLVSAYWWVVFSAARSARAWRLEADLTPPRPLKVMLEWAEAIPFLRWWLPRLALRLSRRATQSLWAPARAVETDFARFAGLGLARVVASIPLVRIALRAPLVVAAGEALEAEPIEVATLPVAEEQAPALSAAVQEAVQTAREFQTT